MSTPDDDTEHVEVGVELGRGVRSIVYAFGDDEVLKVPNESTPDAWLLEELRIADSAARVGAPVPGGRRAVSYAGRMSMVSRRVVGPSMGEVLRSDVHRAEEFGRELARIQLDVWSCVPSYELPLQRDRLDAKVAAAAERFGDDLLAALDLVVDDGAALVLCHGDLHPRNVLFGDDGPLLVDWFDAARGAPSADVARTELVLRANIDVAGGGPPQSVLDRVADAYRASILEHGIVEIDDLERWRVVQSVARLAEGFGQDQLAETRARLAALTSG